MQTSAFRLGFASEDMRQARDPSARLSRSRAAEHRPRLETRGESLFPFCALLCTSVHICAVCAVCLSKNACAVIYSGEARARARQGPDIRHFGAWQPGLSSRQPNTPNHSEDQAGMVKFLNLQQMHLLGLHADDNNLLTAVCIWVLLGTSRGYMQKKPRQEPRYCSRHYDHNASREGWEGLRTR